MSTSGSPERGELALKRPKHRRGLIWSPTDETFSPTARSSEYAPPVPRPPLHEQEGSDASRTIAERPELFRVVTPIDVDRFKHLLEDHPNPAFVSSVCRALREGFWPWADTSDPLYPSVNDNSMLTGARTDEQMQFLGAQIQEEIRAGRLSESFGPDLLPGMYSVPIHAVPKPHSDKLRLVVDHSAGDYLLNSMIASDSIRGTRLDGLHSLGASLLRFRTEHPEQELVMFKSNISLTFRRLPMHPLWQVKQIITFEGQRHVDRNNNFGGRGSPKVWISFMSLVAWITLRRKLVEDLKTYMDDSFSFELAGRVLFYEPYQTFFPAKQTRLLELWDEIRLPHERAKQEFGSPLTVIGFDVDPNRMVATLPPTKKSALVEELRHFGRSHWRWSLREWQRLAGWCEWSFNVFPLLKPGLSNVYDKMAGKVQSRALIYVNNAVEDDLRWMADHMERSDGLLLYKAVNFAATDADVAVVYTDASSVGLGIWFPGDAFACQSRLPHNPPTDTIFYFEALAVCAAVHLLADMDDRPSKLLVYTDNMNTVAMFNSLRAQPPYNGLLRSAMNVLLEYGVDLRVAHVPGEENAVADALSRLQNERVLTLLPDVDILDFIPPRDALGASKK
ncbi:hypothetical protein M405DRAFT_749452 [Rhizopogon salebrosus TDB-379]|nr:hypothetical protein M405DRAFT_749452 [Rhizopogon salebrosus TDB-379]